MSQANKIVLMACGSFSPPTYMHLRMFEIARDYINSLGQATVVGGIVSPVHDAYGKKDLVAAQHRISMLKLSLRSSSWIKVSEWETQQTGWSRTRVSLAYHQETINAHRSYPLATDNPPAWLPDDILNVNSVHSMDRPDSLHSIDQPDNVNGNMADAGRAVTVRLLCGADLLESFATPGLWSDEDVEAIVGRHGLVVVTRSGSNPDKFIYESDMLYKYRRNITLVTNHIANEVSSTVIRRLLRRGDSAKYLTDDAVLAYIRQHRLYGSQADVTEYNLLSDILANYERRSPQDTVMISPEEANFKNILISIRDRPSIVDETFTVKKPRKYFLTPHTDSVKPILDVKPKKAFVDKVSSTYIPGKAVKIVNDAQTIKDDKVSAENTYSSLDSYLSAKDEMDSELFKRRVSEGNVEQPDTKHTMKKRCSSSTIRKLDGKKPENIKKSRSEVAKLCEKMKNVKLREKESGRNYKTRSCNDIVRLVLTKHGIHVISDTEAIV